MLTLYVQEDYFFTESIMIFSSNDVFSSVFQFSSVDDEVVVISSVPLHEFDGLSQFLVVARPDNSGSCHSNDTAIELDGLTLEAESRLWFDHEPWRRLSAIYKMRKILAKISD